MTRRSLAEWLEFQQRVHPRAMDFTLERIRVVLERLGALVPRAPVITVGGTNGKGSVTALAEAVLLAAGRRVGLYTSPHLARYEERIRIDGREIEAERLVGLFERIEAARGTVTLTYFEYATAAALMAFAAEPLDAVLLEVGLGGRLDAVNVVDADVAVVVSVSLDHCDYLGPTVEDIGREKAGIFRAGRPALYGSLEMPASVAAEAARSGARLERLGAEFGYERTAQGFDFRRGATRLAGLPPPALAGAAQYANAATALAALDAGGWLPEAHAVAAGLRSVRLAGRYQVLPGATEWVFDVAHNPGSAAVLAETMNERRPAGRTIVVAGVLADKDAAAVGRELGRALGARDLVCAVTLAGERGRSGEQLAAVWEPILGRPVATAASVEDGCAFAAHSAEAGDRVVVFGSFHTVAPALEWHRLYSPAPGR
ncbi:MAG TPA: bifunctional tetrahydrofolate synthase/dihydrofolate synthase [Steroidobacteraceae bacterium]|nr:bifunctional tetrahydrofolate synthase/dihydrofolate synthase [Steroidobacteraceae bacterium]